MSRLRESVIIKTFTDDLKGELFVGADGLPELVITINGRTLEPYRPATLPAAWTVCPIHAAGWGVLYDAWTDIEAILQHIRDAQREADEAEKAELYREDDTQERECTRATENTLAREIDERRGDE